MQERYDAEGLGGGETRHPQGDGFRAACFALRGLHDAGVAPITTDASHQVIVELPYGRGELPVRLADECEVTVVRKPQMPVLADPEAAVARALDEPVGAPPLADLAAGRKSACILICDVTRPVPNALFLKPLMGEIVRAGIPRERITVLVATGLHRPNEGAELRQVVGDDWVMENIRIENHFARADAAHVDLGKTKTRGTPVKLDRRFVEADLRIATGLVEPHIMAGFSGGCKVVAPGIAHQDTIRTFHNARFLEDPAAVQCNLAGNPLREEQLEIIRMLGEVHAVNTVIDERRRLSFVNFGEIVESHLATVDFAHRFCRVSLPRRFKTVVTSAAGFPLDQTYYQTVKSMLTPMDILDEDATLIVAADCSEGLGSEAYREAQRRLLQQSPQRFLNDLLGKRFAEIDEWQTEVQLKAQRAARIQLFSELDQDDRACTGVETIDCIDSAVAASVARAGDPAVAVIPEGPYVVPQVAG